MKITCGTDIIEVSRIKENIEKNGEKFLNRIFTEKEQKYCESKNKNKYQHYAARFAAKEAVFKTISECLDNKFDINWQHIEILNKENGKPYVVLNKELLNKNIEQIDISLSHIKEYAIANCIVLLKE